MHERLIKEKLLFIKDWEAINGLYNQYLANNAIEGTTVTLKMIK